MNIRALLLLSLLSPAAAAQTEVWIEISDIDLVNKTFTVHADLAADVAGFQFDLTGVEVTGTHGGLAGDAGDGYRNLENRGGFTAPHGLS